MSRTRTSCITVIEAKKAALLIIAHDADAVELFVFLPIRTRTPSPSALLFTRRLPRFLLYRKLRARTSVSLPPVIRVSKANFFDAYGLQRLGWVGLHGNKSTRMLRKRAEGAGRNISVPSLNKLETLLGRCRERLGFLIPTPMILGLESSAYHPSFSSSPSTILERTIKYLLLFPRLHPCPSKCASADPHTSLLNRGIELLFSPVEAAEGISVVADPVS